MIKNILNRNFFLIVQFIILSSILLSNDQKSIDTSRIGINNSNISTIKDSLIDSIFYNNKMRYEIDSINSTSISIDPIKKNKNDNLVEEDIFDAQLSESKTIFAEAIISDLTGDTLEAAYQFELLFESLSNIDDLNSSDEFKRLEFNRLLTAAIDYYEDEAVTLDKVETGFSVSVLKDKLD